MMEAPDPRAALDALVVRHGESYAALSRMLGRNPAYLQQFVRRGSPRRLPERERRLLAHYFRVDEQVLGGPPAPPMGAAGIAVPVIDAVASAGPGGLVEEDRRAGRALVDPAVVAALGLRPRDLSMIAAEGESMAPTILPGDRLLVDRASRTPPARGDIFVIRAGGALMVKRVSVDRGALRITSDNPAYPGVDDPDVDIVGRVVWLGRALA